MKKILFFFCVLLCACGLLLAGAFAEESAEANRLPKGLRSIGDEAFAGTAMGQLELPGSILSIGRGAFTDMPNLKEILFTEPARLMAGRGAVRLDGRRLPPVPPGNASGWEVPGTIPPGEGIRQTPEDSEPAGETAEGGTRNRPRPGFFRDGRSDRRPRSHAAFHPLNLYFP